MPLCPHQCSKLGGSLDLDPLQARAPLWPKPPSWTMTNNFRPRATTLKRDSPLVDALGLVQ